METASLRRYVASLVDREMPVHASLESARRDALARLDGDGAAPWSAIAGAVAVKLGGEKPDPRFVDWLVAESGIEGALDALLAADELGRYAHQDRRVTLQKHESYGYRELHSGAPGLFRALRAHVLSADSASYARAKQHAMECRERSTWPSRHAISFTFPKEAQWAAFDLPKNDRDISASCTLLMTSLDDIESVERLANGPFVDFTLPAMDGRITEVVERFGHAALPFVRRLLKKPTLRALLVASLSTLDGPDVAELMLSVVADPGARDGVMKWLVEHPATALPALTQGYGTGASAKSKVLGPILASLIAKNRTAATAFAATLAPKARTVLAGLGATDTWLPKSSPAVERLLVSSTEEWEALATWLRSGAPAAGRGCIEALVGTATLRDLERLGELARTAARHGGLACAQAIVDAFEATASTPALREISRITTDLADAALTEHAEEALGRLAPRLGLDDEDVLDLGAPDYGIRTSSILLDFGPRTFRVQLDPTFVPKLFDSEGRPIKSLPRPNKKDDATKAERALSSWARLRDEATAEAKNQSRRFEEAMIQGRRWQKRSFEEVVLAHPLLGSIAMRLVWRTESGETFRVAEDMTLADVHDTTFALPDGPVHLPHASELDDALRTAWSEVLASYEILPPFAQLGRTVTRATDIEATLRTYSGLGVSRAARFVLEARSFTDAFHYESLDFQRTIRGLEISIELALHAPDEPPSSILSVTLLGAGNDVAHSELLGALESIVRR